MLDADLCALAAAAYTADPTWQAGDVRAVHTNYGHLSVIAFRGTDPDDAWDWARDLDLWPVWRRKLGLCHRGFITGAEAVFARVSAATWGRRVVLTGHSLGGALAIATAGLLARLGRHPVGLVTFGAPRVGFWRLRHALRDIPARHYADVDDPVPDIPLVYLSNSPRRVVGAPSLDFLAAHDVAAYQLHLTGQPT